jgi:hypothetical protein
MIDCEEKALWYYRRQLDSLPRRIAARQGQQLETWRQEDELAAAAFAVSSLEFTVATLEYERSKKKI